MSDLTEVLVVDLDGTLIASDLLHESFWSAVARDWRHLIGAVGALRHGRAALKRYLASVASVDAATLPYNAEVLTYLTAWRQAGGRTALVTASDLAHAQAVAAHLALFDEVHGSDGQRNLKGEAKSAFLERHFGPRGYRYMGDAAADLPVWRRAATAITVNAAPRLRRQVEREAPAVEHLGTPTRSVAPYLRAMRPHQWLKNTLVVLPTLAAHRLEAPQLLRALLIFVSFSAVASSVYLLNDLLDLPNDRAHRRKRFRPLASGAMPIAHGGVLAALLLGIGLLIAWQLGPSAALVVAGYYLLTLAYSFHLKRRIVIDICTLAALYTARLIAGGVATDVPLSMWLLAFSVFLFLSLAAVKRLAELTENVARGVMTVSGRGYRATDLPVVSMIAVAAGYVAVLVLTLYVSSPAVTDLYRAPRALWGVSAVLLFWITRTIMLAHRGGMHDDPVIYAVKDRTSQLCALLILGFVLMGAWA